MVRVHPRQYAVAALVGVFAVGGLGTLKYFGVLALNWLELDAEGTLPAVFSALLLWTASALALQLARALAGSGGRTIDLWVLGGVFAFMGIDELAGIHENLDSWLGVDNWIVGYLPLAFVGGVAWLVTLLRGLIPLERRYWFIGAALWIGSQLLEVPVQLDIELNPYFPFMFVEEMLEMLGSSSLGLTLLLVLRRASRPSVSSLGDSFPSPARPASARRDLGIVDEQVKGFGGFGRSLRGGGRRGGDRRAVQGAGRGA